jgi:nucleotide-binding universal stress UspA family protein
MPFGQSDVKRVALIAILVAVIAALHYGTNPRDLPLHVFYRGMYFVPILLAALRFGRWGGIATAVGITVIYAPHVAMSIQTPESTVGNVLEIVLFYLFGAAVGSYADIRRDYRRTIQHTGAAPTRPIGHKILVCVDGSVVSQQAAGYAGALFGMGPEVSITLLFATSAPKPDLFANSKALADEASRAAVASENALQRAAAILREHGVPKASLSARVVAAEGARLSDVILREQRDGHHDVIVVGKHRLTRAQEFLFGNVAVRLAREAPCPVLVVGE